MEPLTFAQLALRILIAAALGGVIGFDRERNNRAAGFRTMILVAIGAATFTLAGRELFASIPGRSPADDVNAMSRVIQGIVGGIGFLGAGAILQMKEHVRGVTTAAALWVTAGIGVSAGVGEYRVAVIVAVLSLVVLAILKPVEQAFRSGGRGAGPGVADGTPPERGSD